LKFFLVLLFFCLAATAQARKITIVQASKVELRPSVTTPSGTTEEYIVIAGNPAIITVDEDEITADRIEYNKSTRKLRIVGEGIFQGKSDTIAGRDFEVDLESEGLSAADVFISTTEIDVEGVNCERLPGQVSVQNGYFSPCSRCGTMTDAYGFKAGEITLYPGDRLVARDVTILLAGAPVMYLPIVVVFLSEPSRYPKLELNLEGTPTTRPTVGLDLPFTIGENGFGYWLLRYYAARTPAFGVGFDVHFVNLFSYSNKARAAFLVLPPQSGTDLQLAYRFALEDMRIPLIGREPEDRWTDIELSTSLTRADSGIGNELRGALPGGGNQQTRFDFSLKWSATRFDINTQSFRDPIFNLALTANALRSDLEAQKAIRQPFTFELSFTPGKPLLPTAGGFRLSSWNWSAGFYSTAVNPLNPSATLSINPDSTNPIKQTNIAAFRFTFAVAAGLEQPLWTGGKLFGSTDFAGRYYSTRNSSDPTNNPLVFDGEYERNIVFNASLGVQQSIGTWFEFAANSRYNVSRGETPFAIDQGFSSNRAGNGILGANLGLRPFDWLNLTAAQQYGFTVNFRNTTTFNGLFEPFSATINLNPKSVNLTLAGQYDFETAQPVAYNLRLASSGSSNTSFSLAFGYTFPNLSNTKGVFQDLNLGVGYNSNNRAFTLSLNLIQSLSDASIKSTALNSSFILGTQNPVTLSFNQTYTLPIGGVSSKLVGGLGVRYSFPSTEFDRPFFTGLDIRLSNSFDYAPFNPQTNKTPTSSLDLQASFSGTTPLAFSFRGKLDLQTYQAYEPTLTARFDTLKGSSFEFGVELNLSLPYPNNPDWIWSNFTIRFGWDVRAGISLFGNVQYNRKLEKGIFIDTFKVDSLGIAFAFAIGGSQRPNLFFAMTVNQTFVFQDNLDYKGAALFQPAFSLIYDQCCYSLIATLKPISIVSSGSTNYIFSLVLSLPYGKQSLIEIDRDELRLPVVPLLEPIKLPK
jgi:hypothetical protein